MTPAINSHELSGLCTLQLTQGHWDPSNIDACLVYGSHAPALAGGATDAWAEYVSLRARLSLQQQLYTAMKDNCLAPESADRVRSVDRQSWTEPMLWVLVRGKSMLWVLVRRQPMA